MHERTAISWSGGKDAALSLFHAIRDGLDVRYLFSVIRVPDQVVAIHGVKLDLLQAQSKSMGIPLLPVFVEESSNHSYETEMEKILLRLKKEGIEQIVFGDIFLEDIRRYREEQLSGQGMKALFPLWGRDSGALLMEHASLRFRSIICSIDHDHLGLEHLGMEIDPKLPSKLPAGTDPCGENGEYHSFCFDGPYFRRSIPLSLGGIHTKRYAMNAITGQSTKTISHIEINQESYGKG